MEQRSGRRFSMLNLLEEDFTVITQESQLAVVHHELDAVDLQRFCILFPERRRKRFIQLPFPRPLASAAPSSPCWQATASCSPPGNAAERRSSSGRRPGWSSWCSSSGGCRAACRWRPCLSGRCPSGPTGRSEGTMKEVAFICWSDRLTTASSAYLLSDGRHQVSVAVAQRRHRALLLLLIQHFELVLSERLAWLRHHLDHVQDQNLNPTNTLTHCCRGNRQRFRISCGCSPGPCRWPPLPASDRFLRRCSPSAQKRSPDSSAQQSSCRSHIPTPQGRSW